MKKLHLLCFSLWFATFSLSAQNPFWEPLVGPYGGNVRFTPTNTAVAYATHADGFYYRSADYGEHWTHLNIHRVDSSSNSETIHIGRSGKFYAITYKELGFGNWIRQFYYSLNEGATWELENADFTLVKIWETPSGALVGRDSEAALYRSTDNGSTWQNTGSAELPYFWNDADIIFGNNGLLLLTNPNGFLLYSLNDGQSWNTGGDGNAMEFSTQIELTSSGVLFRLEDNVWMSDTLFYRSTNWGLEWVPVNIQLEYHESPSSIVELSGGRLLLSATRNIYFSDDQGLSWNKLNTSIEKARNFLTNTPLSNGDLVGSYKSAVYRSSDHGATWSFSAFDMQLADVYQLILLNDSIQLATTENGLWRSNNAGNSWVRLIADTSNGPDYNKSIAAINADSFAKIVAYRLWRTTDGGQSFVDISPPKLLPYSAVFTANTGRLFVTDSTGVLMSTDFGLSWQSVIPGASIRKLRRHPGGMLFASTSSVFSAHIFHIHRSSDNGMTWENIGLPQLDLASTSVDLLIDNQGDIIMQGTVGQHYEFARSTDLGATWSYTPIPGYGDGPLASNVLGHLFAHPGANAIILSTVDKGLSWISFPPYIQRNNLLWGLEMSPSGYLYVLPFGSPVSRTTQSTQTGGYIRGRILRDADADCSTSDAQEPLKNWFVEVNGDQEFIVNTSASGQYLIYGNPGTYELHARVPQLLWWTACGSQLTAQIDSAQITDNVDFSAVAASECPLITVDVEVPVLRRCFDNPVYVAYCNSGSESADSAWVDVELDTYLSLVGSEQTFVSLGNNTYRFSLGNVNWGDCGQFSLTVHVDCDSTVIGQTHCITAHGFPDTLCNPVPAWSGATIEAKAVCQDSVVSLQLRNIGTNSSQTLNYIIIEDDVVLLQGQKQYNIDETKTLEYPANGHTWRIESQQEPGHPFSNLALAFVEGCGGFQTLGYVNQFSINGWTPSIDRNCVENRGSYDPNDKQGFPTGFGDAHRIRPGQALEYLIRFQNTGTDTAFTVQIRDTLSAWLDPGTLRPGAASHPYTWHMSGPGIVTFQFDHIMLPDSNTNLAGSQGFVSFQIDQRPEVPLETQITNKAAIYFDFNEPVITNQTLHTVGVDYITSVHHVEEMESSISIQPNPASQETLLSLPPGTVRLAVYDVFGRPMRMLRTQGPLFKLERGNLPAGMYMLRAEDRKGKSLGNGKLIWR